MLQKPPVTKQRDCRVSFVVMGVYRTLDIAHSMRRSLSVQLLDACHCGESASVNSGLG